MYHVMLVPWIIFPPVPSILRLIEFEMSDPVEVGISVLF